MALKTRFSFSSSETENITALISKFGGQPTWLNEPSWPLDLISDEQMLFLCQLVLDEALFETKEETVAYVFISDSEMQYNEGIVIIIQTSKTTIECASNEVSFITSTEGPTIYEIDKEGNNKPQEYILNIEAVEDETTLPLSEIGNVVEIDLEEGFKYIRPEYGGNKIGGQALYIEGFSNPPDFYSLENWRLLLQLAPTEGYWDNLSANFFPFHMELGEFGILTIFISKNNTQAIAYVQQP